MDMKIKNSVILNSTNALKELMECQDVPVKVSFKLIKNVKKIDAALEAYNATNKMILEKYGERREDGELLIDAEGNLKISLEHIEQYLKDKNELLEMENDIEIDTIKADEFTIEKIKPALLLAIDYMIDFS